MCIKLVLTSRKWAAWIVNDSWSYTLYPKIPNIVCYNRNVSKTWQESQFLDLQLSIDQRKASFRLKFSISVQLKGSNHAIKIKVSTINFIHGLFIWRWIKIITRLKGWKEVVLIYVCSTFSKKKSRGRINWH